jgi:hypothetical protein
MNLKQKYQLSNVRRTLWKKHPEKMKKMALRGSINNQRNRRVFADKLRNWAEMNIKKPISYSELLALLKTLPDYKTRAEKQKKYSSLIALMKTKGIIRYDWEQEGYVLIVKELPRF